MTYHFVVMEERPAAWQKLFDLEHFIKNFEYCISWDGVAVNLADEKIREEVGSED